MFAHGESNATELSFPRPHLGTPSQLSGQSRDTQFSKISFVNPLTFCPPTHLLLRDSEPRHLDLEDLRVLCLAGLDQNPSVLPLRVILVLKNMVTMRL
jgi:hypothetical protein